MKIWILLLFAYVCAAQTVKPALPPPQTWPKKQETRLVRPVLPGWHDPSSWIDANSVTIASLPRDPCPGAWLNSDGVCEMTIIFPAHAQCIIKKDNGVSVTCTWEPEK
jgi:hypothetical protein